MERIDSKTVYEGKIASVRHETFRFEDGGEEVREVVGHPGAVAILAHDERFVYMVRQPREPVNEPDLLELPAGKRDVEGESRLECAQRELAEEIGMSASDWAELRRFYVSPGLLEEEITLFRASGLGDAEGDFEPDEDERIEIVPWPLEDLDGAIEQCHDAKSLVGLFELRAHLAG
jgi:8-oxo-dGTP pyrophosphatase MutT (NUDIX family)